MKRRLGWKAVLSLPACYRCFVFLRRGKLRVTTGLTNCYGNLYQIYVSPTLREFFSSEVVSRTCSQMLPLEASFLFRTRLLFLHQRIQRTLDLCDIPICHPEIAMFGVDIGTFIHWFEEPTDPSKTQTTSLPLRTRSLHRKPGLCDFSRLC